MDTGLGDGKQDWHAIFLAEFEDNTTNTMSHKSHKKVILYGAGLGGKRAIKCLPRSFDVIAVADDDQNKVGSFFCGLPVISTSQILQFTYDMVVITSWIHAKKFFDRLMSMSVSPNHIHIFKKDVLLNDKPFPWQSLIILVVFAFLGLACLALVFWLIMQRIPHG